jgi:hypothetical protein
MLVAAFRKTRQWSLHATQRMESILFVCSSYGLPIVVLLFSLVAIASWDNHYSAPSADKIAFRLLQDDSGALDPAAANLALAGKPAINLHETGLSEAPHWLSFSIKPGHARGPSAIEFPSRHTQNIACWAGDTLRPLGSASRDAPDKPDSH